MKSEKSKNFVPEKLCRIIKELLSTPVRTNYLVTDMIMSSLASCHQIVHLLYSSITCKDHSCSWTLESGIRRPIALEANEHTSFFNRQVFTTPINSSWIQITTRHLHIALASSSFFFIHGGGPSLIAVRMKSRILLMFRWRSLPCRSGKATEMRY